MIHVSNRVYQTRMIFSFIYYIIKGKDHTRSYLFYGIIGIMDDNLNDFRTISELDQLDQRLRNLAGIIGNYYWYLIQSGLPPLLAQDLTKEYHFLVISGNGGQQHDYDG